MHARTDVETDVTEIRLSRQWLWPGPTSRKLRSFACKMLLSAPCTHAGATRFSAQPHRSTGSLRGTSGVRAPAAGTMCRELRVIPDL